jgi:hypothetical protein
MRIVVTHLGRLRDFSTLRSAPLLRPGCVCLGLSFIVPSDWPLSMTFLMSVWYFVLSSAPQRLERVRCPRQWLSFDLPQTGAAADSCALSR